MPEMPSEEEHKDGEGRQKEEQIGAAAFRTPIGKSLIDKKHSYQQVGKFEKLGKFHHSSVSSMICTPILERDRKLLNS